MLSYKYIAGFMDSDGCVMVKWKTPTQKPILSVSWSQRQDQDEVLYLIQEVIGGSIRTKEKSGTFYSELVLTGKEAHTALNRFVQHLVIKRDYAEACIAASQVPPIDLIAAKARLKAIRVGGRRDTPQHPSRKWLAGYFDGDGNIACSIYKPTGTATIMLNLATAEWDLVGIQLVKKAFGGSIRHRPESNTYLWCLSTPASKFMQLYEYFGKHMVVKKSQMDFLYGCSQQGSFYGGAVIRKTLMELKAHQHRLNEPKPDVYELVRSVPQQDKPWGTTKGSDSFTECKVCNRSDVVYYAKGMCENCYAKIRRAGYAIVEQAIA